MLHWSPPSFSRSIRSFFRATNSPVRLCFALSARQVRSSAVVVSNPIFAVHHLSRALTYDPVGALADALYLVVVLHVV